MGCVSTCNSSARNQTITNVILGVSNSKAGLNLKPKTISIVIHTFFQMC
jgi:hypothetical protein